MDYKEFLNAVVDEIGDYLLDCDFEDVSVRPIEKNNGVLLQGLMLRKKDAPVAPNIYMEYYYSMYESGASMETVLAEIAAEYRRASSVLSEGEYADFSKDAYEDHVFLRVVNYKKNEPSLRNMPYILFHDLAVTFRYLTKVSGDGVSSTAVENSDLVKWGEDVDHLFELAKVNTLKLFPPRIERLDTLIARLLTEGACPVPEGAETGIYVLTNTSNINGATSMLLPEAMELASREVGEDFYILPSSVHELLLVPEKSFPDREGLERMVYEINRSVVSEMDYLSDSVYHFDTVGMKMTL